MPRALKYHQAILDLLDLEDLISTARLAAIEKREKFCGVQLPASVREWFTVENGEGLFYENTNEDHLTKLAELGVPAETAQGYLHVATENQAVVAWYVRLNESDDPPVYHNNDEWNEDLSKTNWQQVSKTFTNFVFDMIASNHFHGWYSGMRLSARDQLPGTTELGLLSEWFQKGPTTNAIDSKVYRFFNTHGVITVRSVTAEDLIARAAEWSVEADSAESLLLFAHKLWRFGTLSQTLKAESYSPGGGNQVLNRLRAVGVK